MGKSCHHSHTAVRSLASLKDTRIGRRAILKATAAFAAMAATTGAPQPRGSAQDYSTTMAGEWHQPAEIGGSDGSLGFQTEFPFHAIAPHWPGETEFAAAVEIQVSGDGDTFSDPVIVGPAHTDAGRPDRDNRTFGQLVFTEPAQYVRYRTLNADGLEQGLPGLSFTYIDATGGPTIDDIAPSTANPSLSRPPIITREEWGANLTYGGQDRAATEWPLQYQTIEHVIIHHSETPSFRDPLAEIRSIHYYHAITRGWGDIGYNYLVDFMGNVYEGRVGGENVVAGHAYQYSYGSAGICAMGSYKVEDATPEALAGLIWITAWAARGLDPLGRADFYERPNLPTIAGHRDVNESTCPGDALYADLDYIRGAVAEVFAGARETIPNPEYSPGHIVAMTVEGANLREKPGLVAPVKREVPYGAVFQVIEGPTTVDGYAWYNLDGDLGSGWASTSTFAMSDAAPPAGKFTIGEPIVIAPEMINLRSEPTLRSLIVATLSRLAEGTILEGPMPANGYRWYKIDVGGIIGWSAEQYLARPGDIQPPTRFVIGDAVEVADPDGINLRTEASASASVIVSLSPGVRGAVVDGPRVADKLSWLQVQTSQGTGWVAETYLRAAPVAAPPPAMFAVGDTVVVATDALNLRDAAGVQGTVIASLGTGMTARIAEGPTAANNLNWYRLEAESASGWAVEAFLARADAAQGPTFAKGSPVYVTTDALNLRAEPTASAPVLGVLFTNEPGTVIDGPTSADGTVWYRIESAVGTGWSAAQYLGSGMADPTSQIRVGDRVGLNTDGINVRSGPGVGNPMVIIMLNGEEGDVTEGQVEAEGYRWFKLSTSRGEGWAVAQYLRVVGGRGYVPGDTVRVIDGDLNLRSDPGLGAELVAILPDSAFVQVIEGPSQADGYDWYRVSSSQFGTGWSVAQYLARG